MTAPKIPSDHAAQFLGIFMDLFSLSKPNPEEPKVPIPDVKISLELDYPFKSLIVEW